uniref:Uncharacterized protein n=1 Tax=Strigamia maritima TaxID=126957 RepID=T1J914_STRMM
MQSQSVTSAFDAANVPPLTDTEDTVQKLECKLTSKNCTAQPIIVQVEHIIRNKAKSSPEKPQFGVTFNSTRRKCKSPRTNEQERKTIADIIDLSSKDEEIAGTTTLTNPEEAPLESTLSDPRLLSGADPQLPPSSADSSIDDVAQTLAKLPWRPYLPEDSSTEYEITCCGWKKVKKARERPVNGNGAWGLRPNAVISGDYGDDQGSVDSNWPPEMPEMPENGVIQSDCYCVSHNDDWVKGSMITGVKKSNSDDCYCHGPKMNIPLPVYEPELDAMKEDYGIGNCAEGGVGGEEEVGIKKVKFPLEEQKVLITSKEDETLPNEDSIPNKVTEESFSQLTNQDSHQRQSVLPSYYDRYEESSLSQHHCEPLYQEPYQEPQILIHESNPRCEPYQEPHILIHESNPRCGDSIQYQRHCEPLVTPDQGDSTFQHYNYDKPMLFTNKTSFPEGDTLKANSEMPIEDKQQECDTFSSQCNWQTPTQQLSTEVIIPQRPSSKSPESFLENRPNKGAFNAYSDHTVTSKLSEKLVKNMHHSQPPSPTTVQSESQSPSTAGIEFSNQSATSSSHRGIRSTPNSNRVIPRLKVVLSPDENWKKVHKAVSPSNTGTNDEISPKQKTRVLKSGQESPILWSEAEDTESLRTSPSVTLPPTPMRGSPEPGEVCRSETPLSEYLTPSPKFKTSKNFVSPDLPRSQTPSKGSQEFFETQRYPTPMELQSAPSMSVPEATFDIKKVAECAPDQQPMYADNVIKHPQDECKCAEILKYLNVIKCPPEVSRHCREVPSCPQEVPRCYDVPSCSQEVPKCYDVPSCPQEVPRCYDVPSSQEVPRCYDVPSCPQEVPRCYDVPSCPPEIPMCPPEVTRCPPKVPKCPPDEVPRCPEEVPRCPEEVPTCSQKVSRYNAQVQSKNAASCPLELSSHYDDSVHSYFAQCPESSSCPKVEESEENNDYMSSVGTSCHCLPSSIDVCDPRQLNFLKKRKCEKPPSEPIPEMKRICSPSSYLNKSQPSVYVDTALGNEKMSVATHKIKQQFYVCEPVDESLSSPQFQNPQYEKYQQFQQNPSQFQQNPSQFQQNPSQFQQNPSQFQQNPPQFQQNPPQFQQNSSQFQQNPSKFQQNPFELLKQPLQEDEFFWQNSTTLSDLNFIDSSTEENPSAVLTDTMFRTFPDMQTSKNESWKKNTRQIPKMPNWCYQETCSPNNTSTISNFQSDPHMPQHWNPPRFDLNKKQIGSLIHSCDFVRSQEECVNNFPLSPCQLVSHQPSTPPVMLNKPFCQTLGNISLLRQTSSCNLVPSKSPQLSFSKNKMDSYIINSQYHDENNTNRESSIEYKSKLKSKTSSLLSLNEKQRPHSVKHSQKLPPKVKPKESLQQQHDQEFYLDEEYAEHLNLTPDDDIKKIKTICVSNIVQTSFRGDSQPKASVTSKPQKRQQGIGLSFKNDSTLTKLPSSRKSTIGWQWNPQAMVTCPPSEKNKPPAKMTKSCSPIPRSMMQQHLELYPEEPNQCRYQQCLTTCNVQNSMAPVSLQSPKIQEGTMPYSELPYNPMTANAMPNCTFQNPQNTGQPMQIPSSQNIVNSQFHQVPLQYVQNPSASKTQNPSAMFSTQSHQPLNIKVPQGEMLDDTKSMANSHALHNMTDGIIANEQNSGVSNLSPGLLSHGSNFTKLLLPSAATTQDKNSQFQRQISSIPQEASDSQLPTTQLYYGSKPMSSHNQETQTLHMIEEPIHYVLDSHFQLLKRPGFPHHKSRTIATDTSEIDYPFGVNTLGKQSDESKYSSCSHHQILLRPWSNSCHCKKTTSKIETSASEIKPSKSCKKHNRQTVLSFCPSDQHEESCLSESHIIGSCPSNTETICQNKRKQLDVLQQPAENQSGPNYNHCTSVSTNANGKAKTKTKKWHHRHCPYTTKKTSMALPNSNFLPSNRCWYCRQPLCNVNPIPVQSQAFGNVNRMPVQSEVCGNLNQISAMPMQSQSNYIRIAYIPVPYVPQNHQVLPRMLPSNYPYQHQYQYQLYDECQLHENGMSSSASSRSSQQSTRQSLQHVCKPELIQQEHHDVCSCQGDPESDFSDADSGCVTPTPIDANGSPEAKERCPLIQPVCVESIRDEPGSSEIEEQEQAYFDSLESTLDKPQTEECMEEARRTCSVLKLDASKTEEPPVEPNQNHEHKFHSCQCSVEGNLGQQAIWPHLNLKRPMFMPLSPPLAHPVVTSQSLPTEFDPTLKNQRTIRVKKSPRKNKSPLMDIVNGRSMMEANYSHLHANSSVSEPLINGHQPPQEGHIPSGWSKRRCHHHRSGADQKNVDEDKISEERSVSCNGCATPNSPKLKCACSVLAFNTVQTLCSERSSPEYRCLSPEAERPTSRKRWTTANEVNIVKIANDAVQDEKSINCDS